MITVHKYPLTFVSTQFISLPEGAEVLIAGLQNEQIFLWAKVNPTQVLERTHMVEIAGTGRPIVDPKARFMGHIRMPGFEFFVFLGAAQ